MVKKKARIKSPKYTKKDERLPGISEVKQKLPPKNIKNSTLISASSATPEKRMLYKNATSYTAQVLTNIPYTPQDYVYFEDAWAWTLAGLSVDKKLDFVIGKGITPTIDIIVKAGKSEEQIQEEAKKYEYVIDKLTEIDELPAVDAKQTFYDAARMAKVFGRSVCGFEYGVESNKGVPIALKIIHPRDLGRVQVNEVDWSIESVINYMGLTVGESNIINAEDMIYMVNAPHNPMRRNLYYGHSEMQRIIGAARALRRILEYDVPEIVEGMWAGYGLFLVDPEGKAPSDVQSELNTLLTNLSPGTFGAVSGKPNEKVQFIPLDLKPNIDGIVKLIDVFERLIIGNQTVPAALLGREEDSNMACYSEDTLTLTENGWKYYWEINTNEKIATYNPDTKQIEYNIPDGFALYDYKGKMIHFKSRSQDILVTPNHTMWVSKYSDKLYDGKNYKKFERKRADELLNQRSCQFETFGEYIGKEIESMELAPTKWYGNPQMLIQSIKMDTWLEFLGYYLSEGTRSVSSNLVGISQKEGWKHDIIKQCIDKLPFNYYDNFNPKWNVHSYNITNKQLSENLNECGKTCYEKTIPRWILQTVSKRQLKILFDAMMLGDGTVSKNGVRNYYTTSKQLAEDIQELSLKIGSFARIRTVQDKRPNRVTGYRVSIYKKKGFLQEVRKEQIKEIDYDGKVYCFNVKNHLFITMRNGCPTIQGNTLFGKIRLFIAGPVAQDREWLGNILDRQWYNPNLKKLFPNEAKVIRIKTEFEPIITESWIDNIDALQKLSITIPQLPSEKLLELVGLENYKNDLEPTQGDIERVYQEYPPSKDQVQQMYDQTQQQPITVPQKGVKPKINQTVPPTQTDADQISSKDLKRKQMAQGAVSKNPVTIKDDIIPYWDDPVNNVSRRLHTIDPNEHDKENSIKTAQKDWKDLLPKEQKLVIVGYSFRHKEANMGKLLPVDPRTSAKNRWSMLTPSMRNHILDPHDILGKKPTSLKEYDDLKGKEKEEVDGLFDLSKNEESSNLAQGELIKSAELEDKKKELLDISLEYLRKLKK